MAPYPRESEPGSGTSQASRIGQMAKLPSGTVTFLLTDIEGSTALWEEAHETMHAALARHDTILVAGIEDHGGILLKHHGEGDSTFAVFAAPSEAVSAALAIQRALADEPWPTPRPIRVRIGIHSGEAWLREGDYFGPTVNRCARLRGLGHGGQTLLSEATATLVRDLLPDAAVLVDLGEHGLKDLDRPEHVYQLTAAGLRTEFPSLTALDPHRHNLPVQPTPLIGREREIQALHHLLVNSATRLVTLTGPGGTGKTRLGIQVAAAVVDAFEHGSFMVSLAPLSDPDQVIPTIARTLGVKEALGRPPFDAVLDHVRGRHLLLLLDNFEHVLQGAAAVSDLLRASPTLAVLVTSRAPLQIAGEREYPVPPLDLPDVTRQLTAEDIAHAPAIALFVERAAAIRPSFMVTPENAHAIAEICRRLDGLPLAIELAAARVRLFSPEAMLPRLAHGLGLLTAGRRDLPERHQTLRNAMAWSYDLLSEAEQRLFRRLSVFVGGFTLDAAEAVCVDAGADSPDDLLSVKVLDGIESLVVNSLVHRDERESFAPRFRMLETIREYGLEQLAACGEQEAARSRHLAWCLGLLESSQPHMQGPAYAEWLDRLDAELENLHAALSWSERAPQDLELGLRLTTMLARGFWTIRGHFTDGRTWLSRMLTRSPARTPIRAMALNCAGFLALRQNDHVAARPLLEEALQIWREVDDKRGLAIALRSLGVVEHQQQHFDRAGSLLRQSLDLLREMDDPRNETQAHMFLADLERDRGELAEAAAGYGRAHEIAARHGDSHGVAYALRGLGHVARLRGEYARARELIRESLCLLRELRDRRCIPLCLEGLACMTSGPGWAERATRLLGAARAIQQTTGAPAPPAELADFRRTEADARATLGGEQFKTLWQAGAALTLDEAVGYALAEHDTSGRADAGLTAVQAVPGTGRVPLSAREREVVELIAAGLSNRQIADRLVLSVRTVERHIENVYNRLGISGKAGRAIVTAYALRHHLVGSA
jgi:predicted ATPase/class 3 adenylate cyclase/DNA-binding CsgD family transcriptional regulator